MTDGTAVALALASSVKLKWAAAQGVSLRPNRHVTMLGDSRAANGVIIAGQNYNVTARSIMGWARNLSKQAFDHDDTDVVGVGGYTSEQVLALAQANLSKFGVLVCAIVSTNDRVAPQQWPASRSIAAATALESLITGSGRSILWLNEMPRGGSNALTGSDLQNHLTMVEWYNSRSGKPNVYVAPSFGTMVDPASASASEVTGMLIADRLHPSPQGAYSDAIASLPVINSLFPPRPMLVTSSADAYDASLRPDGCLNANPLMTGTGGTKNAGGGTFNGTAPDNWTATISNGAGLTVTGSQVTVNGVAWQQFVLSGTPTATNPQLQILSTTALQSNIAVGDLIDQLAAVQVDAGQTGVWSISMDASMSSMTRRDLAGVVNTDTFPTGAIDAIYHIGPFTADAAATGFYKPALTIQLLQNVAVSLTIRMRAMSVKKKLYS